MSRTHTIAMLGTGLVGTFYTMTLHAHRRRDRILRVYSRDVEKAQAFARRWGIPKASDDLEETIQDPEVDVVVVGLPNDLHATAVCMAAEAKKAVLCTKPLGRDAAEAWRMVEAVKQSGVFAGYLEDLCYTPKLLKALALVQKGALGRILWVRSRETHPGPHSAWFWDRNRAGGGAIVDVGCHCIEIIRTYIGKQVRPVEVMCLAETTVHPIEAEDSAIGLIRFEDGAIGQFEAAWTFRGGMDLRDEIAGTEGTIWLNHFLRTGFEMYTTGQGGYVAEKAEAETGWLFPVGDEVNELGYNHMFTDMFEALDAGREPVETFFDGYVVNAVIDACYASARSRRWEPVRIEGWPYPPVTKERQPAPLLIEGRYRLIKEERLPDGHRKRIVKDMVTGEIGEQIVEG